MSIENLEYIDWKVGKSIKNLLNNANKTSTSSCAKYIRKALQAGGIVVNGNPIYAKDYHFKNYLKSIGFNHIKTIDPKNTDYIPLPGDIAVMESPMGGAGHICMWSGNEWISDFKQSNIYPYRAKGINSNNCYIYRWSK